MNFDDYEQLPTTSVATNMTAGAIAGVLEHCLMYPLDSVKTRMQSLSPITSGHSITSTFTNMIKKEGVLRPIRGVSAVVAGAGPAHAFYFGTYEYTKEFLTEFTTNSQLNYIISAVTATLVHDAISNPTEVIKQRLQMYNSPFKSVIQCTRSIYKNEGLKAFYRSYSTQLIMNLPYQAIHFTTYEFFQNMLNSERRYNPPVHVIAGAAAGAASSALTTPLDVIKTLLNTQESTTRGMREAISRIFRIAGPLGFFKGLGARVLYAMPATAICWSTYEFFKFTLAGKSREDYKSSISGRSSLPPKIPKETNSITSSSSSSMTSMASDKTRNIDNDTSKIAGVRYVLPTSSIVSAKTGDIPSTIKETSPSSSSSSTSSSSSSTSSSSAPIKVCELPTVSGEGIYNSLSLNTRHTEEVNKSYDRRLNNNRIT